MLEQYQREVFEAMVASNGDLCNLPSPVKSFVANTIAVYHAQEFDPRIAANELDCVVTGMLRAEKCTLEAFSA